MAGLYELKLDSCRPCGESETTDKLGMQIEGPPSNNMKRVPRTKSKTADIFRSYPHLPPSFQAQQLMGELIDKTTNIRQA